MDPFGGGEPYNPFAAPSSASRPVEHVVDSLPETSPNVGGFEVGNSKTRSPTIPTVEPPVQALPQPQQVFPPISAFAAPQQYPAAIPSGSQGERDLSARERELAERERLQTIRENSLLPKNFPPFPNWFCVKPCFYVNIKQEIDETHQHIMRLMYLNMVAYLVLLFINMIGAISYGSSGAPNHITHAILGVFFMFSVGFYAFYMVFWTTYKCLRTKTRFNYILCLVSLSIFIVINISTILGVKGSGWSGLIVMIYSIESTQKSPFTAVVCAICFIGSLFTGLYHSFVLTKIWRAFTERDKTGEIPIETSLAVASRAV